MPTRLADRLKAARRKRFVGRSDERDIFQSALSSTESPFQLLYVFGPGGIGKTTLLREFLSMAAQAGVPAQHLDARNLETTPESFYNALRIAPPSSLQQTMSTTRPRPASRPASKG